MSSLFLSPKENNNQTDTMSTKKTQKASAIKKSFKTRKESIKKKTMELSVLCDVNACAVIIGPDGSIETWPEDRNHVQQVIQQYRNCDRKRKRTQELDHGCDDHCKKKQDVRFFSEGAVKNQGTTNQELLTVIDAKLAQVRNRIRFLKFNDQGSIRDGSNEYTDSVSTEMSIFQEKTSCDHTVVNSLWFDTKLDEIEGFEETEQLSSWLDSFLDKQPEIQDNQENPLWFDNLVGSGEQENQEILKTTPNAFNSGSELPETFALPYDQKPGGEFLETLVFPNDQEFQPFTTTMNTFNSGSELLETFVFPNEQEFQPFAMTMNTIDSGSVFVDSSALWWDAAAAAQLVYPSQ
ncbi:putative ovule protein [Abeliophyllum distichum]|uniref:Ovule protein n=1 Tax=Abeliophyllum distichum TaxID=126358 RepID=A0ABD1VTQ6_9LAMI